MSKVLLADDEPSIIETLRDHIPWSELGFTTVLTAANGNEALELLQTDEPDVAVFDIQMPGLSGLELAHRIYQGEMSTRVIILSGYAEFSYAQKAMQYNVLGYLLKPVEIDELTALLSKAVNVPQEHSMADRSIIDILEENDDSLRTLLSQAGLDPDRFYLSGSISDQPVLTEAAFTFSTGRQAYVYLTDRCVTVDPGCDNTGRSGHRSDAFLITDTVMNDPSVYGIGIYPEAVSAGSLRDALYRCDALCYSFFIDPGVKYIPASDDTGAQFILDEISDAVHAGNRTRVLELMGRLRDRETRRHFTIHDASQLVNRLVSDVRILPDGQDYRVYHYRQLVYTYGTFDEMINELTDLISQSSDETSVETAGGNTHFLRIAQYLGHHYSENISLRDVSVAVNLSPGYISQLFKSATGDTFTHYLTGIRIEKAKELLSDPSQSLSDIAISTGFNDYFYFLKAFKKRTGQTPSGYRAVT